jgi:DNA primase
MIRQSPRAEVARLKAEISIVHLIAATLTLKRQGPVYVALCPFHGERTPSFTVYPDHYHCFGCGARGDALDWLMRTRRMSFREAVQALGGRDAPAATGLASATVQDVGRGTSGAAWRQERARRIWCDAVDARATPVEVYLRSRGVRLPEMPVIRFHPHCPRTGGALPAMVSLMTDPVTNQPCGVLRTFLHPDGTSKAHVAKPKMMLGGAGVIRLAEPLGAGLGIAEGIETALSCMQLIQWGPVWAAGSSGLIERFPVLPCTTLNIFADADDSGLGLAAARACAERWTSAGQEALIHLPRTGLDWNDAMRGLGA